MGEEASALPQRLTMVTLGVRDVAISRAFYEKLGFRAAEFDSPAVAFFDMGGTVFGLYGREPLAEDAGVSAEGDGFRGVSLSINFASRDEVDRMLAFAQTCGAKIVQPAREVFWGGYSGYFADPDGHLWEIAFNPFWPLDEAGRAIIPPPSS